jgi:hypothetical protein
MSTSSRFAGAALALMVLPSVLLAKGTPEDDFLTPTALHTIHVRVTALDWKKMEPPSGLFGRMWGPKIEDSDKHRGQFGHEFVWVKGSFEHGSAEHGGALFSEVGLRFKGNSSYELATHTLKRPMKVEFDRFVKDQTFRGMARLNLHNNALDPSHVREALSYWVFRDAKVPAPRTAYALGYLTVDGVHDRKLLGLYTLVEEVDENFLESRFGSAKGLLLKPEMGFGLPYEGEDFKKYEDRYRPKTKGTEKTWRRLVEFTRLIHKADDATFEREIENVLDVEAFLRFVAANGLLANTDSFLSTGHNFFMYVHPKTLKVHFVPWDLNLSIGGFDWVGSHQELVQLSVKKPYVPPNQLLDRLLAIPRYQAKLREVTEAIVKDVFNARELNERLDQFDRVIESARERALGKAASQSATGPATRPAPVGNVAAKPHWLIPTPPEPRGFLKARAASVEAQLAGKDSAYEPQWSKGPFGQRIKREPASRPTTRASSRPISGRP